MVKLFTSLGASLLIGLTACSPNNLNKSDNSPGMAKDYLITRQFQRVVRYNCTGQLISDKVETVSPPNIYVQTAPQNGYHLDHADYLNLTTNSRPGCITSQTQFSIDTSPTACNMQVVVGLNQIKYDFYYCDSYITQPNGSANCSAPLKVGESGQLYINIKYQEKSLDGMTEVKPTSNECLTRR